MTWVFAILLAAACFGAIAWFGKLPLKAWTVLLAALAIGLAGYGLQASPDIPGAPGKKRAIDTEEGFRLVEMRKELLGEDKLSRDKFVVTADALMRRGQYANAAALLRGVVRTNPRDAEAWLAMANALTFEADGVLTPAALYAYRHAAAVDPEGAGPSFFVGLAFIRQGQLIEGREIWAQGLKTLPEGSRGHQILAQRLADLDELLRQIAARAEESGS